jgi:PAS domain S-box-containing protein
MNSAAALDAPDVLRDLNLLLWEANPTTLRFTYVSRGAEQMLGYSLDRWLRQPMHWSDLLHPDDRDAALAECRRAVADCRDHTLEYRMIASDGRVIWVRDVVRVICDTQKHAVGLRGVMIDITERKNAELALDRPEDYFRTLVRQSVDIVTVVNARGVILYENPAAGRILGYEVSSRIGRSVFDLVHPDDLDAAHFAFEQAFTSGELSPILEFRCRDARGDWRTLEASGRRFIGGDGLMVAVINSRDVTDRRKMDERIRNAQKMEALVRLAGSMAHEFDQVLSSIDQHAEATDSGRAAIDAERAVALRQAVETGSDLTHQLLQFSRRTTPSPTPTDAVATLLDLREVLTSLLGQGIALEIHADGGSAPVSLGDALIETVLTRLVANARDAMPWGGTVHIRARRMSAPPMPPAGARELLVIEVADTGVGMSLHVRSRIFEPFFTTKAPGRGTGLGLATVYGIVQSAGGDVSVESELGRGTKITITLPVVE